MYQDTRQIDYENSLSHPDKMWVVMYNEHRNWSEPTTDRYEAEQEYWSAKDSGEDVSFGYYYEGSFTGKWEENIKEFRPVNL